MAADSEKPGTPGGIATIILLAFVVVVVAAGFLIYGANGFVSMVRAMLNI